MMHGPIDIRCLEIFVVLARRWLAKRKDCMKYVIVTQVSGVKYSSHLGRSATSTGKTWRRAKMTKMTKEQKREHWADI